MVSPTVELAGSGPLSALWAASEFNVSEACRGPYVGGFSESVIPTIACEH
jgi:hypothetical protein